MYCPELGETSHRPAEIVSRRIAGDVLHLVGIGIKVGNFAELAQEISKLEEAHRAARDTSADSPNIPLSLRLINTGVAQGSDLKAIRPISARS
jgi:hypothetical protein